MALPSSGRRSRASAPPLTRAPAEVFPVHGIGRVFWIRRAPDPRPGTRKRMASPPLHRSPFWPTLSCPRVQPACRWRETGFPGSSTTPLGEARSPLPGTSEQQPSLAASHGSSFSHRGRASTLPPGRAKELRHMPDQRFFLHGSTEPDGTVSSSGLLARCRPVPPPERAQHLYLSAREGLLLTTAPFVALRTGRPPGRFFRRSRSAAPPRRCLRRGSSGTSGFALENKTQGPQEEASILQLVLPRSFVMKQLGKPSEKRGVELVHGQRTARLPKGKAFAPPSSTVLSHRDEVAFFPGGQGKL